MFTKIKIITILLLIILPIKTYSGNDKNLSETAVKYVKTKDREARNLNLFVSESYDFKMIRKNRIFKISTADVIPLKVWIVVIGESGNPTIHSTHKIKPFNLLLKDESLEFKSKKDFAKLIKLFVGLTEPGETVIDNDKTIDRSRLKSAYKRSAVKTRIEKGKKGVYRLTFFSTDTLGSIKMWRLYFDPPATLKKVSRYKATHY